LYASKLELELRNGAQVQLDYRVKGFNASSGLVNPSSSSWQYIASSWDASTTTATAAAMRTAWEIPYTQAMANCANSPGSTTSLSLVPSSTTVLPSSPFEVTDPAQVSLDLSTGNLMVRARRIRFISPLMRKLESAVEGGCPQFGAVFVSKGDLILCPAPGGSVSLRGRVEHASDPAEACRQPTMGESEDVLVLCAASGGAVVLVDRTQ